MFDMVSMLKLLAFYIILLAVTSVKLDDLVHDLRKKTLLNKKGKKHEGV
jgi:hypothetical protein